MGEESSSRGLSRFPGNVLKTAGARRICLMLSTSMQKTRDASINLHLLCRKNGQTPWDDSINERHTEFLSQVAEESRSRNLENVFVIMSSQEFLRRNKFIVPYTTTIIVKRKQEDADFGDVLCVDSLSEAVYLCPKKSNSIYTIGSMELIRDILCSSTIIISEILLINVHRAYQKKQLDVVLSWMKGYIRNFKFTKGVYCASDNGLPSYMIEWWSAINQ